MIDRASWIAGYAAALEFCADDESRLFWGWNETSDSAAADAWIRRELGDETLRRNMERPLP